MLYFHSDVPWSREERKHLEYCIPRVHLSVRYSSFSTCSVFTGYHLSLRGKKVFEEKERKKEKKRREKRIPLHTRSLESNRLNVNNRDDGSTGISLKKYGESNIFFSFLKFEREYDRENEKLKKTWYDKLIVEIYQDKFKRAKFNWF